MRGGCYNFHSTSSLPPPPFPQISLNIFRTPFLSAVSTPFHLPPPRLPRVAWCASSPTLHPPVRRPTLPAPLPKTMADVKTERATSDAIKLFIGQVPRNFKESDLKEILAEAGNITDVNIVRDKATKESKGDVPDLTRNRIRRISGLC